MRERVGRFIWTCWAFYMGVHERVGRVRCASVLGSIVKIPGVQLHESHTSV